MTPHELGPSGPIVAVAIAVVALAALAIIVRRLVLLIPGTRVAEAEAGAREPHSFELRYASTAARAYRLALRMRVHGQRWGQSTSTGVVCRLRVTVGGRLLVEEALGFGSDLPRPVDREITRGYISSPRARSRPARAPRPRCSTSSSGDEVRPTGRPRPPGRDGA